MSDYKTAIVTGAYGAIGKAIAEYLARKDKFKVILLGREIINLQSAKESIINKTGNEEIYYSLVDLSLKKSIKSFCNSWDSKIDVLINNAGATPRQRLETSEGVELQWATNVMAYFHMMVMLSPFMEGASDPRIVNVASYWAGGLDMDDVEFRYRTYNNDKAYRQSKQADRMLSLAFSKRLKSKGISVFSCHPGDVNSKLSNNLGYGGHESPVQGAATPVWLATSESVTGLTGKYFENLRETHCQFSEDEEGIERLFELCSGY